jgi:hypothetical protein
MPLVSKAFGDIITFTRASSATFTGSNGLIQSATTNTPRFDYDPVTLAAKGLLIEEQRTNIVTYSEDFSNAAWAKNASGTGVAAAVTADAAAAPDGTTTADLVTLNRGAGNAITDFSRLERTVPVTNATAYTQSFYVQAATAGDIGKQIACRTVAGGSYLVVTLTSSWQRVTRTETSISTSGLFEITNRGTITVDNTVSFNLWGAQLEAGAFATSYIPTVASQVTRSADAASVNTLSPWYNATEGTLFTEVDHSNSSNFPVSAVLTDSSPSSNQILIYTTSTGTPGETFFVRTSGTIQANINGGSIVANNTPFKIAGAYKANDFAVSLNGAAVVTDTSGTIPVVDRLGLGSSINQNSLYLNGHIRRITYYPRRLSNAELQAITA